jgi:hypothetical protein
LENFIDHGLLSTGARSRVLPVGNTQKEANGTAFPRKIMQ